MRVIWIIALLGFALINLNCSTGPKSSGVSSMMDQEDDEDNQEDDEDDDDVGGISSNTNIFAYSLSNSSLTTKMYSRKKARNFASDLERSLRNPTAKNLREMVALMSLTRMSGGDLGQAFNIAKRVALNEMKIDIARKLPESVSLELALSSIQARNYSMADHWISELVRSKDKKMQAAAQTAKGVIELLSNRLPEAIYFWNEALKRYSNYEPARLNIGFFALKYGDIATAKRMLGSLNSDYFITTGLMQAERLANRPKKVSAMCDRIRGLNPKYKPALFSCALNTYQGLGNLEQAKKELEKVAQVEGAPVEIDEKAFLTIGKVEAAQKRSNSATKKP